MDFYTLTSQEILERLSRHLPETLSTYFQCINRADKEGTIFFSKDMVEVNMSESWPKFRNDIRKLARENLLEWHPFDKGISVTLVDLHEDD